MIESSPSFLNPKCRGDLRNLNRVHCTISCCSRPSYLAWTIPKRQNGWRGDPAPSGRANACPRWRCRPAAFPGVAATAPESSGTAIPAPCPGRQGAKADPRPGDLLCHVRHLVVLARGPLLPRAPSSLADHISFANHIPWRSAHHSPPTSAYTRLRPPTRRPFSAPSAATIAISYVP